MNNPLVNLPEPKAAPTHVPFGRHLLNEGLIEQGDLNHALRLQSQVDAPLGEIMVSEGLITRDDILEALSLQSNAMRVDLDKDPPSIGIAPALEVRLCLEHTVLPWRETHDRIYIATGQPLSFDLLRIALGGRDKDLIPVICDEEQIRNHIGRLYGPQLACRAANRVAPSESCRGWAAGASRRLVRAGGQ